MKQVTGGNGQDTTAAVMAYLAGHKELRLANLYLIGEADDPAALWLTDYESPLLWGALGTGQGAPAAIIPAPDPPFTPAAGESVAWSTATQHSAPVSFANTDAYHNSGLAFSTLTTGSLGLFGGSPVDTNSVAQEWSDFLMPPEVPEGATITRIVPFVRVTSLALGGNMNLNCGPSGAGIFPGINLGANSPIGASLTSLDGMTVGAFIQNSLDGGSAVLGIGIDFVGLAVYYEGPPQTIQTQITLDPAPAPLMGSGTFLATVIKRGNVSSKIGLEAESLDLTWSPKNKVLTTSIATASYYQLARMGYFDNKRVRVWRCVMPTPGDANTFGAFELFGGFIGDTTVTDGSIKFSVNSYLYVVNQKVPSGVIEVTNTTASYSGGAPPNGFSVIPQFSIVAGSTPNLLICNQISPTAGSIPSDGVLTDAAVVFNGPPGATLQGQFSIIGNNTTFIDGHGNHHTQIQLFSPLPWAPTPGADTFYVSGTVPTFGGTSFPFVPSAQSAI